MLLAEVDGIRILLTGDIEPEAQRALLGTGADLAADVLKVPHHGSANTLPQFLAAASPRVAVIGVGADNGYGHPNPRLLQALSRAGVAIRPAHGPGRRRGGAPRRRRPRDGGARPGDPAVTCGERRGDPALTAASVRAIPR